MAEAGGRITPAFGRRLAQNNKPKVIMILGFFYCLFVYLLLLLSLSEAHLGFFGERLGLVQWLDLLFFAVGVLGFYL